MLLLLLLSMNWVGTRRPRLGTDDFDVFSPSPIMTLIMKTISLCYCLPALSPIFNHQYAHFFSSTNYIKLDQRPR